MKGMSYVQRLQVLNLPSLKYRRYRGDLIQTFKILNKVDDLNIEDFYTFSASSTRNSQVKVFIKSCCTDKRKYSFSYRTAKYWNNISSVTKYAKNVNEFKNLLQSDPNKEISCYDYDN